MHQIKFFKGLEHEADKVEQAVNAWLKNSRVKVVQILGNIAPQTLLTLSDDSGKLVGAESGAGRRFAPSDIFLVVLYEAP